MTGLALISNSKSHRNLHAGQPIRDLAASPFIKGFAEPATHAELLQVLREFKRQNIDMLIVNGGDGTIRDVLTALRQVDPVWAPALLIVPGGKTNLIGRDVGATAHGAKGLLQILTAARKGTLGSYRVRRPIMEITRAGSHEPPLCGLFFGAGAFSSGVELARTQANKMGLYHGVAVLWTIAAMLLRSLRGISYDDEHKAMALIAGDQAAHVGRRYIVIATTLERLMLGIKPFWGPRTGAICYTDIDAPPVRLGSALLAVLRGRPHPWMEAAGYRSGSANRLMLKLTSPFTLDGELFDPGPENQIELVARRMVEFVRP